MPDPVAGDSAARDPAATAGQERGFRVSLDNFDGPFDLLLRLITDRRMDVTEVSLSLVTDEFIAYLGSLDSRAELDQASEFIVVAATLLDLKAARLLPQGELVDADDVAALEARDLLFARLLQYRAFKLVASWFRDGFEAEAGRLPRRVPLEERFRQRAPTLRWTLSAQDFAALAVLALTPREAPTLTTGHLHAPLVSIREQAAHVVTLLREAGTMTFRELIADVRQRGVVVARFLALLELYRHASVGFEQDEPLGELVVTWQARQWTDENLASLGADYEG